MKLQPKLSNEFFYSMLTRTPDVLKMGRLLITIKGRANANLPNRRYYYYTDIGTALEQSYLSS